MAMWPDDEEHGTRIDPAIDAAARQMTDGVPGADLKARVLARIGERESSSRGWRLAWILSPAAVAAIILLIVIGRSFYGRDHQVESPAPQPPVTAAVKQQPASTTASVRPDTTPVTRVRSKPDAGYGLDANRTRTQSTPSEIAALVPAPLDVESIRVSALPPADSIRVAPLEAIEPIDVEPLAAPEIDDTQRRER
jgi:hypothetical protein